MELNMHVKFYNKNTQQLLTTLVIKMIKEYIKYNYTNLYFLLKRYITLKEFIEIILLKFRIL